MRLLPARTPAHRPVRHELCRAGDDGRNRPRRARGVRRGQGVRHGAAARRAERRAGRTTAVRRVHGVERAAGGGSRAARTDRRPRHRRRRPPRAAVRPCMRVLADRGDQQPGQAGPGGQAGRRRGGRRRCRAAGGGRCRRRPGDRHFLRGGDRAPERRASRRPGRPGGHRPGRRAEPRPAVARVGQPIAGHRLHPQRPSPAERGPRAGRVRCGDTDGRGLRQDRGGRGGRPGGQQPGPLPRGRLFVLFVGWLSRRRGRRSPPRPVWPRPAAAADRSPAGGAAW